MNRRVLLLSWLIVAAGLATAEEADFAELVRGVAARLEFAVRSDPDVPDALRGMQIRYLLEPASANAKAEWDGSPGAGGAGRGLILCWDHHDVFQPPSPPAAPEQTPALSGFSITIGGRVLAEACEGNPTRAALVLGHEISHITLGHLYDRSRSDDDIRLGQEGKQKEFAADEKGLHYALGAGYADAEEQAVELWGRWREVFGDGHPLDAGAAFEDHPTASERMAALVQDQAQRRRYQHLVVYDDGVSYLALANWDAARGCFEDALESFEDSPELLTNLGYSKMMGYYTKLPDDARDRLGGEVSCQSFVTARPLIRGGVEVDETLLLQAIEHFKEALAASPGFLHAQANLGTALVMKMPSDSSAVELAQAVELLQHAAEQALAQNEQVVYADAISNLALARCRLEPERVRAHLEDAERKATQTPHWLALRHNLGEMLAQSGQREDLQRAEALLSDYLSTTAQDSVYARGAKSCWIGVREALGMPHADEDIPQPRQMEWLEAKSVLLPNGHEIRLRENWPLVPRSKLAGEEVTEVPVGTSPSTLLCDCPSLGIQLRVWRASVRAILLTSPAAPRVRCKSGPYEAPPWLVFQVGEPAPFVERAGGVKEPWDDERRIMADPVRIGGSMFFLYHGLQVALQRDGPDRGQIRAIALIAG